MTDETELQRLIAVANGAGEPRAELAGCVDRLYQVQTARAPLARLDDPRLRASPEATRSALRQGSAQ
ncbi:hypothetical protein [Phycicoccus sp. Root101]|uniref:hypothetical protein n=1 Tax=Phycicoccus sp. Root101 TaxID=1736421 RepID=UPI0012F8E2C6|nr:hypothetical protein [Phycicoccus sp. Root101]